MEIFISIDGVLRNTIQKFEYHYRNYYIDSSEVKKLKPVNKPEPKKNEDSDSDWVNESFDYKDENEFDDDFKYEVIQPIGNDDLLKYFTFHSQQELDNFLFIDFPIEIFGHASISYPTAFTDLNRLIYENKDINFTIIGLDELAKAKPSSLFFLSRNGFLGNHIKFIKTEDIDKSWEECDLWITDNENIIKKCPFDKNVVKFETLYNQNFTTENNINKLPEIERIWSKFLEKNTTSI